MPKEKTTTLREARQDRGLTLEELAKKAHLPYSTVQSIESGRIPGDWNSHVHLALALGLTLKEIFPETAIGIEKNLGPFSPKHTGKIIDALYGAREKKKRCPTLSL